MGKVPCKCKPKKTGGATCVSDTTDFNTKTEIRGTERHYIMIKGLIHPEVFTFVHIYTPNIGTPTGMKQTLIELKGKIESNTIIAEDFNTSFTSMG